MKTGAFLSCIIVAVAIAWSCNTPQSAGKNSQTDTHNSRNSLDWDGAYRGMLPCRNCNGLQTTIWLNKDERYRATVRRMGTNDSTLEFSGNFTWNNAGNTITLQGAHSILSPAAFFVGENTLTQLDQQGNRYTGSRAMQNMLTKDNFAILEKYWKLVELNGRPVAADSSLQKEPHIILNARDNRMTGHGGCNHISGRFIQQNPYRISFQQVLSTQMACPDMEAESQLLNVLNSTDSYTFRGDTLTLIRARMAPLAKFVAESMK